MLGSDVRRKLRLLQVHRTTVLCVDSCLADEAGGLSATKRLHLGADVTVFPFHCFHRRSGFYHQKDGKQPSEDDLDINQIILVRFWGETGTFPKVIFLQQQSSCSLFIGMECGFVRAST